MSRYPCIMTSKAQRSKGIYKLTSKIIIFWFYCSVVSPLCFQKIISKLPQFLHHLRIASIFAQKFTENNISFVKVQQVCFFHSFFGFVGLMLAVMVISVALPTNIYTSLWESQNGEFKKFIFSVTILLVKLP